MLYIRPTLAEDAPLLCQLQKAAFLPLYERYHDSGNPFLRDEQDILLRLEHPAFRYFTVVLDDEIIGGALWRISGRTPAIAALPPHEYYLQRIFIKPSLQGMHLARKAILLCEAQFPDAVRFHVDFPADLEKNRRCYAAAGYRDTGKRLITEQEPTLAVYAKDMNPTGGTEP